MSKSIDTILKELIENQTAQTVALNDKLTLLAGDKDTYTERMKKMEDGLTEAMKKVLDMDATIKEFNKEMAKKVDEMEAKFAGFYKAPEKMTEGEESEESEEGEDSEDGKKVEVEVEMPKDESKEGKKGGKYKNQGGLFQGPSEAKMNAEYEDSSTQGPARPDQSAKMVGEEGGEGGNVIEGVNKEVVTGQPKDEEDAPKMKRVRGGKQATGKNCKESDEAPQAEQVKEQPKAESAKEVKAEQAESAPVASDESTIKATAEALNSKIEAVLEKLASVSQPKPEANAELEAAKVALANEAKAKEEAVAQMKALSEKFEALMSKVSTIEKSASTVEQKAAQIVASTGVEAVAVSVDQPVKAEEQTDEETFKQFETLKGTEQRKFYLANKAKIERHASALLRAKRS